jgi:hypothetical protein
MKSSELQKVSRIFSVPSQLLARVTGDVLFLAHFDLFGLRVNQGLISGLRLSPNRFLALHRKSTITQLVTAARVERTNAEKGTSPHIQCGS